MVNERMTDARTQALAKQYSEIYGDETDNDYVRGAKPMNPIATAQRPICGTNATVLEDRVPALLEPIETKTHETG